MAFLTSNLWHNFQNENGSDAGMIKLRAFSDLFSLTDDSEASENPSDSVPLSSMNVSVTSLTKAYMDL